MTYVSGFGAEYNEVSLVSHISKLDFEALRKIVGE